MRIAIRADGGRSVGLGHLGRCAALAQAFRRLGKSPVFVEVAPECRAWVRAQGLRTGRLGSRSWDLVVADSYRFRASELARLRRAARTLVVIDDFGTSKAACDWVLSSHIYAPSLTFRANHGAAVLAGPRFHPMRRDYWTPPRRRIAAPRIRNLLVTLGGGAASQRAAPILAAAARALPRARVHWAAGHLSGSLPALGRRVLVHRSLPSLRRLAERCDAAVSAGGQSLYELIFTGLPTVALSLGFDQDGNIKGFAAAGAAWTAGSVSSPGFIARLQRLLRRLDEPGPRRRLCARSRGLLDGRGALRVARLLLA